MTKPSIPIQVLNVDRNVSFRDYRHIEGKKLLVAPGSPFLTFQGEGPIAGKVVVFLRLSGCNIGAKQDCTWCDTRFNFDEGCEYTPQEIFDTIRTIAMGRTKTIVVTGGEPLLQKASLEVLGKLAHQHGWDIQIETNGYFVDADTLPGHMIVVSPKIPHNKDHYLPIKPDWATRGVHLKYVVTADPESKYHRLPQDAVDNAHYFGGVYVSAMCVYKRNVEPGEVANIWDETLVDREATAANYAYAASLAIRFGLRVSYQTHLFGVQP